MKADFEDGTDGDHDESPGDPGAANAVRAFAARASNELYDESVRDAILLVLDEAPHLLDPAGDFSLRLKPEKFAAHIVGLVSAADALNNRKLPIPPLARESGYAEATIRALLARHPLLRRIQPVRAALELAAEPDKPKALLLRTYAGIHDTTMARRGIHRPKPSSPNGRQMHLELVAITDAGRPLLVHTERFACGDVTWASMRRAAKAAIEKARDQGIKDAELLRNCFEEAISEFQRESWGSHTSGPHPETVVDHVETLFASAVAAAEVAGRVSFPG